MRFQVYHINGPTSAYLRNNKEALTKAIKSTKTYKDNGMGYCLNNVDLEESVILFTISQEYFSGLTKTNPDDKQDELITEYPWDRTLCAIDTQSGKFLIQRKRYSPKNLNPPRTLRRVEDTLRNVFLEDSSTSLELISTTIGINNEYFRDLFLHADSQGIKFNELIGRKLQVGTPLHNPREEWDRAWAESWNEYDSELVDSIVINGKSDTDLKKSPLTKLLLATDAEIQSVTYYDEDEHKKVVESKRSAGSIFANIFNDEEVVTQQKELASKIQSHRNILAKLSLKRD